MRQKRRPWYEFMGAGTYSCERNTALTSSSPRLLGVVSLYPTPGPPSSNSSASMTPGMSVTNAREVGRESEQITQWNQAVVGLLLGPRGQKGIEEPLSQQNIAFQMSALRPCIRVKPSWLPSMKSPLKSTAGFLPFSQKNGLLVMILPKSRTCSVSATSAPPRVLSTNGKAIKI